MLGITVSSFGSHDEDYSAAHQRMMRAVYADVARNGHLLADGELSAAVAGAMARVPRHLFVPPQLRNNAYANRPLSIGHGQTISQPTVVALMTELLGLEETDRVLEIGTGSGYQAAILAEVVSAGRVHTIEIVPELARSARERLRTLGYDNVTVHEGDGTRGLPDQAPFAGIIVTAAAEEIPPALIDQLASGGTLIMPVGSPGSTQWLTKLERKRDGEISRAALLPVRFVPLTGGGPKADRDR